MICNASLHCWGNAQCLMDAREVVIHEVHRHGVFKVLDLLAETVGQSREATLPEPGTEWDAQQRMNWLMLANSAFNMIYKSSSGDMPIEIKLKDQK